MIRRAGIPASFVVLEDSHVLEQSGSDHHDKKDQHDVIEFSVLSHCLNPLPRHSDANDLS